MWSTKTLPNHFLNFYYNRLRKISMAIEKELSKTGSKYKRIKTK